MAKITTAGVSYEPGHEPDGWVAPAPDPDGAVAKVTPAGAPAASGRVPAEGAFLLPENLRSGPESEPGLEPKPAPARAPKRPPMGDGIALKPVYRAVLAKRTAASSCCGAKLTAGTVPQTFECVSCGQPCDRVFSEPEEVIAHG